MLYTEPSQAITEILQKDRAGGNRIGCYGGNEAQVILGMRKEEEVRGVVEKCEGGMVKTKMMEHESEDMVEYRCA
ncbi:uncharacterized protein G2W53_008244 [Senna tora]|uniref:Uncharacterized protein n=1 Tax=Senna tora TaxID=362788 RepID=A0A835CHZ1_9FABA|nr:uncharacterized protein G2W53_008244 [Senna tora]